MVLPEFTDEEAIATALLVGGVFVYSYNRWYVDSTEGRKHPIERANHGRTGTYGFDTRAEIARAYLTHVYSGE